jgi:hypothetical protein
MVAFSIFLTGAVSLGLFFLFRMALLKNPSQKATTRVFLLVALSVWVAVLWRRPFEPTWLHLAVSVAILLVLLAAVKVTFKPPSGRGDTLHMLDRVHKERALDRSIETAIGPGYWFLLLLLIALVVHRYVGAFVGGQ